MVMRNIFEIIKMGRISKNALALAFIASELLFLGCTGTNHVKESQKNLKNYLEQTITYCDQGQYDQALVEINKALDINPRDADMFNVRGVIYFEKGEYDRAISDYSKAIALEPQKASFYDDRGCAYWRTQHYDKAIADHSRAIELEPENALFYAIRGHAWYLKDDYDKALADANKAIELANHPEGYHVRGHTLYLKGEHDKAISDFSKAIELTKNQENAFLYICRGSAFYDRGAYEKAYSDISKAMELEPTNASNYNALAWMLATCPDVRYRDGRRAIELAKKAIKLTNLKFQKAAYIDTLAAAYAEIGCFEDAVSTQQKVLSLLYETKADSDTIEEGIKHFEYYKAKKPWRVK